MQVDLLGITKYRIVDDRLVGGLQYEMMQFPSNANRFAREARISKVNQLCGSLKPSELLEVNLLLL